MPDRMAVKPNPWAIGISTTVNVTILLILLLFVGRKIMQAVNPNLLATNIDVGDYRRPRPKRPAAAAVVATESIIDPNKGKLPRSRKIPITPPEPPPFDHPPLPEPAAIDVQKNIQFPDNPDMPMIGMHTSVQCTACLGGNRKRQRAWGRAGAAGWARDTGTGMDPANGGQCGWRPCYQIGGGAPAPTVLHSVEAEFSDEARRAKYQGVCLISLIVDTQGNPQNIRIARALGMGLDEKAIEAIRQYKFKPAMKDGKTPVPAVITIEVDFRLY